MKAEPTATLIARLKREAKTAARTTAKTHSQALDAAARAQGYQDWHELHMAHQRVQDANVLDLPMDPQLPSAFDSTPNEDRSAEEVAQWWDRPYVLTRSDGTLDVRCLDGASMKRVSSLRANWHAGVPFVRNP